MAEEKKPKNAQPDNSSFQHDRVKRVLRILTTLQRFSDENHPITQAEIRSRIEAEWGKEAAYMNPQSLSRILNDMIHEMNTEHYLIGNTRSNDEAMIKSKSEDSKRIGRLMYNHPFSYKELDNVIDAVKSFDDIGDSEKKSLIVKLANLSSNYYKSKWVESYNNISTSIKEDTFAGTIEPSKKSVRETHFYDQETTTSNLKEIRKAIEWEPMKRKIQFYYTFYNADAQRVEKRDKENKPKRYVVTPFRIIKYNGRPYLVCCKDGETEAGIYRVDLMEYVSVLENEKGIPVSEVKNLHKNWLDKDSMSQRLNMHFGETVEVTMEVPAGNYTFIHDWFGDSYSVSFEHDGKALVKVRTNPSAMADWAMQYSSVVTVIGPKEVTDLIKEKLTSAYERYKC